MYLTPTLPDKVAVVVQMEQYVRVTEDYQLEDKPFGPKIAAIRYIEFKVVTQPYMHSAGKGRA